MLFLWIVCFSKYLLQDMSNDAENLLALSLEQYFSTKCFWDVFPRLFNYFYFLILHIFSHKWNVFKKLKTSLEACFLSRFLCF